MLILQSILDQKKAELIGNLYRQYVFGEVDYQQFLNLSDIIYNIFLGDIPILKFYSQLSLTEDWIENKEEDLGSLFRLQALGLLHLSPKVVYDSKKSSYYVSVEKLGEILSEL